MRTEERSIVGAFIFSSDDKLLLGFNKHGGVYQGQLTIPGGGIEKDESVTEALIREIKEETAIDISAEIVDAIDGISVGESQRIDPITQETVSVRMAFRDFTVRLSKPADLIELACEDDWGNGRWYTPAELTDANIAPNVRKTLLRLGFLK